MSKLTAKITPLLAALAFALLPLVATAQPPTGQVKAQGATKLIPPPKSGLPTISCITTLTGTISGPPNYDINVSTANFAPNPDIKCFGLEGKNLTWLGSFNSTFTQLTIHDVTVAAPTIGLLCGPDTLTLQYNDATDTVQLGTTSNPTPLGACAITGELKITPLP